MEENVTANIIFYIFLPFQKASSSFFFFKQSRSLDEKKYFTAIKTPQAYFSSNMFYEKGNVRSMKYEQLSNIAFYKRERISFFRFSVFMSLLQSKISFLNKRRGIVRYYSRRQNYSRIFDNSGQKLMTNAVLRNKHLSNQDLYLFILFITSMR